MNKRVINEVEFNEYETDSDKVIVFVHGASEGALRYSTLVNALNDKYNVITYNHPGHETGKDVDFDYNQILDTTKEVLMYAQGKYDDVTIFAHSMGSIVVRNLLVYIKHETKLILSGAPVLSYADRVSAYGGLAALTVLSKDKVSDKMNYLTFDKKAADIGLSDKAWLSSQSEVVELFKSSKLNNQKFTNRALNALLEMTINANSKEVYKKLRKYDLLLVSGMTDTFTNNGLNYRYITKWAPKAQVIVYPNSYHEVHNDIDKMVLIKDIRNIVEKDINGKN